MRLSTTLEAAVVAAVGFASALVFAVTARQVGGTLRPFGWNLNGIGIEIVETWGACDQQVWASHDRSRRTGQGLYRR